MRYGIYWHFVSAYLVGAANANLFQRLARIHELELLRQDALHKTESITRDEEARLLQLRLLTMRDENASLREKLGQKDFKISTLIRDSDQIRIDLDDRRQIIRAQEARLKKQDVDRASLKVWRDDDDCEVSVTLTDVF